MNLVLEVKLATHSNLRKKSNQNTIKKYTLTEHYLFNFYQNTQTIKYLQKQKC